MPAEVRCGCCGVALYDGVERSSFRAQLGRCLLCDICDGRHGDELQYVVERGVAAGAIPPGQALARMALDDAHMAGMLRLVPNYTQPGNATIVDLEIPQPVARWRVVLGRAVARGTLPDFSDLIRAVIAKYKGVAITAKVLERLRAEMLEMMSFVDPHVVGLELRHPVAIFDMARLDMTVQTDHPAAPHVALTTPASTEVYELRGAVELPADILTRPRGQA